MWRKLIKLFKSIILRFAKQGWFYLYVPFIPIRIFCPPLLHLFLLSPDRILLCSPGWSWTTDSLVFASWARGLQTCAATADTCDIGGETQASRMRGGHSTNRATCQPSTESVKRRQSVLWMLEGLWAACVDVHRSDRWMLRLCGGSGDLWGTGFNFLIYQETLDSKKPALLVMGS